MSDSTPDPQQALCGTKGQYRRLFENAPTPMWVFDNETLRILVVNKAAIRLYGYSREEFLAMSAKDLRPSYEVRRFMRHLSQMRPWHTSNAGIWKHRRKDGTVVDREITATRVMFRGKEGWLVSSREVDPAPPHTSSEPKRPPRP
ncbi:MAG TPA: PAS domain-containing protein [Verrucomicrobiae bacterium]|nr:PAS domain-containing protein [Verrucomicrobiae bacterium]